MKRLSMILMATGVFGGAAIAGPFAHLMRAELALKQATSWHVTEQLPGGKVFNMDYSAPNRWRVEPAPNITEVIIGSTVYMVTAGHVMQLPPSYAAMIARTVHIHMFDAADRAALRSTLRDLGAQALAGKPVHVYRYVLHGITQTWYIGAGHLPVQAILSSSRGREVVQYSRFGVPVSIEPPQG